ncbi:MAG: BamA/TamA family outer membrane protein [Myxococcales bacterium]|nr:BamA/TamA family outer membrane protein [Myxococcales bacterium]
MCDRRLTLLVLAATIGCASAIPPGKTGVRTLELRGVEALDEGALRACLATHELPRFGFDLGGRGERICGQPPFDAAHVPVKLWAWPWTEWPLFDPVVFERDQERIERWYRARGYYGARVTGTRVRPVGDSDDGREVKIAIDVQEGRPVLIERVWFEGLGHLEDSLERDLTAALTLVEGGRFDEFAYEESKDALRRHLGEAGYAHALVTGHVHVDPRRLRARVRFVLRPGRKARFGRVFVRGHGELSASTIWGAAGIRSGDQFRLSTLEDARQNVYALGPFASVEVEPLVEPESDTVHVLIKVVRSRTTRWGFGIGMESGGNITQQGGEGSFAQWDIHLLGRFEHRNFLGGMRRVRVEDRPRLIFDDRFPSIERPNLGNALEVDFRQPAFIEPRMALLSELRWDLGPDPFGGRFFRSDFNLGVGPERGFFRDSLVLSSTANWHQFRRLPGIEEQSPYPNYDAFFLRHHARLELRDDPRAPSRGAFASLSVLHAGYFLPGDFDYVRVTPDVRGYLPLPAGLVLATRARIGIMIVTSANIPAERGETAQERTAEGFRDRLRRFGPLRHRLRGGGHNSVRGYRPNELGDVVLVDGRLDSGGLRQWEASLELRVPITANFGAVLFADAGDVTREKRFRFDHPQVTFGLGLRYRTLVGPLRLDAGFAPRGLQVFGEDTRIREGLSQATALGLGDGAVHLTIGEAF